MSEPFVGEIQMFGGNFAPRGWALCNGQLLLISQYEPLFALIGTTYGGDGESTFALPDLRGRVPVGVGTGPGLSPVGWGAKAGTETVTLTPAEIPSHSHALFADPAMATNTTDPQGAMLADTGADAVYGPPTPAANMDAASIDAAGGNQAHENVAPSITVNFIIALLGIFPSP